MANADTTRGFKPIGANPKVGKYKVDGSQTIAIGDLTIMGSDGYVTIATSGAGAIMPGVAASPVASSTAGDTIYIYDDPDEVFYAQTSDSYAIADAYDSLTFTDFIGLTGAQEVAAKTNSSTGCLRIMGLAHDPISGQESVAGSWANIKVKIASAKHLYGTET